MVVDLHGLSEGELAVEWLIPPSRPRLPPGVVDIWRIELDAVADSSGLSRTEVARSGNFLRPLSKQRFLRSRQALREILGLYLNLAPAKVSIIVQQRGKPALAGQEGGVHFNLSHAGGIGLLAVSKAAPLGVDIEWLRPISDLRAVAEISFPESLYADMSGFPNEQESMFFKLWTRYEAGQKAFGLGMFGPMIHPGQLCYRHFVPVAGSVACVALACSNDCLRGIRFFGGVNND